MKLLCADLEMYQWLLPLVSQLFQIFEQSKSSVEIRTKSTYTLFTFDKRIEKRPTIHADREDRPYMILHPHDLVFYATKRLLF